ncbi:MAG: LPS-assembly protein LptD [Alphaproteobacteria bacterium]
MRRLLLGLAAALLLAAPVGAETDEPRADEPGPVFLAADEVSHDEELGLVIAKGNVEITRGERTLRADSVTYNQKTGIVTASGDVSLLELDGTVYFAEYVELTEEMKNGVVRNLGVLLANKARIVAAGARLQGGVRTEFRRAIYSPCELCEEDPTRAPLWQVKAIEVTHDKVAQDIEYHDAWMELYGVPVFYTPYLSHPDPTVRRRTGLLAPTYGVDSQLGGLVRIPYFVELGPDKDVTIEPIITTNERAALAGEYRQRFDNGTFETTGSITRVRRRDDLGNRIGGNQTRGHLFTEGLFDIDPTWRGGFEGRYATDDTYLRRYRISSIDSLVTRPFIEGFHGQSYSSAQGYYWQGLRQQDDQGQTPIVLPMLDYQYVGQPDHYGGRLVADANLLSLLRTEGTDSRRLSLKLGWERPFISSYGDLWKASLTLQSDGYWAEDVRPLNTPPTTSLDGFTGRVFPQAGLEWRYPFAREAGETRQIISPVAAVFVAPNGGNPEGIPNEDSIDFELDDTNLFKANRFTGLDRVEGATRVIYGLEAGTYGNRHGHSSIFLGQSYRFRDDDTFEQGSGLFDRASDIVGRVRLSPAEYLDLLYRFRFDQSNFDMLRNEVGASVGPSALRLRADYLFFKDTRARSEFGDREQIAGSIAARLTENWSTTLAHVRNIGQDEGSLATALGVNYEDECIIVNVTASNSQTRDRDFEDGNTVLVRVLFKTLGEVKTSTN